MDKRFHTDTRVSENFSVKGLQSLTGQEVSNFLQYMVKEIIDNSLEVVEYPSIEIVAKIDWENTIDDSHVTALRIRDNGPGIPEETIHKIFKDIENFGGTKRHYKLPTRGAQGNALMTVLGIQTLFHCPLVVISNSDCYTIFVAENDLAGCPEIKIERQQVETPFSGLEIGLDLYNFYAVGRLRDIKQTYFKFVELNPHATFRFVVAEEDDNYVFAGNPELNGNRLKPGQNNTTGKVIWFTKEEFYNRIKADVRVVPELKLSQFVQEFYGFSSYQKAKKVIGELSHFYGVTIDTISDFFTGTHLDKEVARRLYEIMCEHTERFNERGLPNSLGSIGKEGMKYSLLESLKLSGGYEDVENIVEHAHKVDARIQSIDDLIVYYSKGAISEYNGKVVPHYFELIAMPISWQKETFGWHSREGQFCLTFGINQSFIYSVPSVNLFIKKRDGKRETYSSINSAFYDFDYRFKVICNLTCPTIDFKDKGKQLFDTEPFVDTINEVLGKTIRKFQTDIIPVLNKLNERNNDDDNNDWELEGKAPKGFIKKFVFDNFMKVYNEATEAGRYTITQRQFYYPFRDLFMNEIKHLGYRYTHDSTFDTSKRLELNFDTFTTYLDEYEVKKLGERIIYKKDRGFFVEPHSGKRVNLGTASVEQYYPDLKQYGSLLFVEKSGFYELLHEEFELTKKYDIGLINSEGYATNALRLLIEKIQRANPEIKLYVLTDFDIKGLGIAKNVKKPDELSPVDIFDCEHLGITYQDIIDYDLPVEPVEYDRRTLSELNNRYAMEDITDEVYEFLSQGQRVEIQISIR